MGDARQIEMLRAKVMASMPLRKSQQQTTLVALEEREEGELSAEDDEPMVLLILSSSLFFFFFFVLLPAIAFFHLVASFPRDLSLLCCMLNRL
jgi:uncharacterized membrane-anchored protein